MISYAHQLGLGEKTGINSRNESKGRVPKLKSGFAVNHMSSHGDDFKVTALQLATLVSAMANGGKLLTPFVPRTPQDEKRSTPKVRRLVNINADSFKQMVPGMIGSVSYGSGRRASNPRRSSPVRPAPALSRAPGLVCSLRTLRSTIPASPSW